LWEAPGDPFDDKTGFVVARFMGAAAAEAFGFTFGFTFADRLRLSMDKAKEVEGCTAESVVGVGGRLLLLTAGCVPATVTMLLAAVLLLFPPVILRL
jgi:hypothetical protein